MALTWRMESPTERAAWSARSSTSALRALATDSGSSPTSCGRRHVPAFEGGHVGGALGAPRRGRGGLGGRLQAGVAQIGGVGEPGGVTAHDPDPGATLAAGHELLDLGVVETRRCAATILGEHLGEIATVAQRGLQGALEYGFLDQVASYGGCLS